MFNLLPQAGDFIYTSSMILGIDEVGRGPWAGPLVVGAVVLGSETLDGLTDSKKISKKRRAELSKEIYEKAAGVGLGWVHADELDTLGMSASLVLATRRAVEQITAEYHEIIIDGTVNFLKDTAKGPYVTTLKKADLLIASVSAASIVAKVARDAFMEEQSRVYPMYGFESHSGYGTARHRDAIEHYGVTPLHRLSFAPLAKYAPHTPKKTTGDDSVTTKQLGDMAESEVAMYLEQLGHSIVERNWKTKFCEIDIVSRKDDTYYFTEVKYRITEEFGGGMAAITPKKLKQMKFAAQLYVSKTPSLGQQLAVAIVAKDLTITDVILIDD